ncbi:MAG TPA: hypothetical protein VK337_11130 [Xanthobacteraceae bacterium]|nr:hypothetical protein [Xanthobacteraceae bacterium]
MAKSTRRKASGRKITLIQTDQTARAVAATIGRRKPVKVSFFVRAPDNVKSKSFAVAARLCGCRNVCLAFVDPD